MERGGHHLDHSILGHPGRLDLWQHPRALDGSCPSTDVESHQLLPRKSSGGRPRHGRVQLHTWVSLLHNCPVVIHSTSFEVLFFPFGSDHY